MRLGLLLGALALTLGGCATGVEALPSSPETQYVAPVVADPDHIEISKLGVKSSLVPLGLDSSGHHEVPPVTQPEQAGWYKGGPEPGQPGPSIILGHINGGGRPGVFAHLGSLKAGDTVDVGLKDGKTLVFVVYMTQTVHKTQFPSDKVYAYTPGPELRVISCGGKFVGGKFGYEDNTIVYARAE